MRSSGIAGGRFFLFFLGSRLLTLLTLQPYSGHELDVCYRAASLSKYSSTERREGVWLLVDYPGALMMTIFHADFVWDFRATGPFASCFAAVVVAVGA